MGTDGPLFVIEVEDRRHGDDVHVGLVVGLERAHVAPVVSFFLVLIDEVVGEDAVVVDHSGQDVFAEIMAGVGVLGVFQQDRDEHIRIKEIDAH